MRKRPENSSAAGEQKCSHIPLGALILASLTKYRKFDLGTFPGKDRGGP